MQRNRFVSDLLSQMLPLNKHITPKYLYLNAEFLKKGMRFKAVAEI